jgi:hypothetical protein
LQTGKSDRAAQALGRAAARIVQELIIKKADDSFTSGWYTNGRVTGKAMLDRVAAVPSRGVGASALPLRRSTAEA